MTTIEIREIPFRCARTGGRFRVLFGRTNAARNFRIRQVLAEDVQSEPNPPGPVVGSAIARKLRAIPGRVTRVFRNHQLSRETHTFDAGEFDFAGWYCPCCGHSQHQQTWPEFVRCSKCGECVCGGRVIQVNNGPQTFERHDGCKGGGRISNNYVQSYAGDKISVTQQERATLASSSNRYPISAEDTPSLSSGSGVLIVGRSDDSRNAPQARRESRGSS